MIDRLIPPQYRILAGLTIVVILCAFSFFKGAESVQQKWDTAVLEQSVRIGKTTTKQAEATVKVVTQYVDRVKVIREKGDAIIKEVPVYVPSSTPDLPPGFRLLHDSAVDGTVPDPSGLANADPVGAREATTTIAGNYKTCNAIREQLIGLQDWVRIQQAIAEARQ